MLNYIWLGLIVVGILVAVGSDWHDLSANKYHNGEEIPVLLQFAEQPAMAFQPNQRYIVGLRMNGESLAKIYGGRISSTVQQNAEFVPISPDHGILDIMLDDRAPAFWKEIAALQKKEKLLARVRWDTTGQTSSQAAGWYLPVRLTFDPVTFVKLNAVTNDGIIKYAKTAVELAIGLIGIMALWLGIMKIAEQSGLVGKLAALLKPITTRVFPDVPADHPAMGAMIMNISANMLGLSNAATPLGLKAMEELNKLNPKAGTATDAMCTFLVINTSNVQLIPATVIAIRAAAGSANPTEILGPVIVATFITLVVGVTVVKLLARLSIFQKQLLPDE